MKIAVIGTGIAGLSAGWLLSTRHEVVLFEKEQRVGGHSNTVVTPSGQAIDTGFIVYNETNYPQLTRLFAHLDVPTQHSDMSFGVSLGRGQYEYAGDNLATLFLQAGNAVSAQHWGMLLDILRFNRLTQTLLRADRLPGVPLASFLHEHRFGAAMASRYLLPMAGAIWSCTPQQATEFPFPEFARFFDSHGLLNAWNRPRWRSVSGGSRVYVERLRKAFRGELRSGVPVQSIRRQGQGVVLHSAAGSEHFDVAVSAMHADQTLGCLQDADAEERRLLQAFRYARNRAILHNDEALMPRRRRAWSSWNYLSDVDAVHDRPVTVSYWMNRLQGLQTSTPYIVTLNPDRAPRDERVLYEIDYRHPQFNRSAMAAQKKLASIQGARRLWFCGAWTGYGFHEDGLRSALQVCAALGVPAPWQQEATAVHTAPESDLQLAPQVSL